MSTKKLFCFATHRPIHNFFFLVICLKSVSQRDTAVSSQKRQKSVLDTDNPYQVACLMFVKTITSLDVLQFQVMPRTTLLLPSVPSLHGTHVLDGTIVRRTLMSAESHSCLTVVDYCVNHDSVTHRCPALVG